MGQINDDDRRVPPLSGDSRARFEAWYATHRERDRDGALELAQAAWSAAEAQRPSVAGADGFVLVPKAPTRDMLNAAIDVDSMRLGCIAPLGFRCSPQQLFERCYAAMLAAAPRRPAAADEREAQDAFKKLVDALITADQTLRNGLRPVDVRIEAYNAAYAAVLAAFDAARPHPVASAADEIAISLTREEVQAVYLTLLHDRPRPAFGWMEAPLVSAQDKLKPIHSAIHDRQFNAMNRAFFGDERFTFPEAPLPVAPAATQHKPVTNQEVADICREHFHTAATQDEREAIIAAWGTEGDWIPSGSDLQGAWESRFSGYEAGWNAHARHVAASSQLPAGQAVAVGDSRGYRFVYECGMDVGWNDAIEAAAKLCDEHEGPHNGKSYPFSAAAKLIRALTPPAVAAAPSQPIAPVAEVRGDGIGAPYIHNFVVLPVGTKLYAAPSMAAKEGRCPVCGSSDCEWLNDSSAGVACRTLHCNACDRKPK